MQRMSVVQRPVAATEAGGPGDRALDIIAGAVDRALDTETLRQAGCDRRSESAAGAVSVAGGDPRTFPNPDACGRDEDIRHDFPGEMPALDQHRSAAKRQEGLAGGPHLGNVSDF